MEGHTVYFIRTRFRPLTYTVSLLVLTENFVFLQLLLTIYANMMLLKFTESNITYIKVYFQKRKAR